MPCKDAMVTAVITAKPEDKVLDVLNTFDKKGIRSVPVVDGNDKLVGVFSFSQLLRHILPATSTLAEGDILHRYTNMMDLDLSHLEGTSPWLAKRLTRVLAKTVEEVMFKGDQFGWVKPNTPLREGVHMMVKFDSPLPVVNSDADMKLVGIISSQTAVRALVQLHEEVEKGAEVKE